MLKRKKFLDVRVKNAKGALVVEHDHWVNEFNLTILPPLTKLELADLAQLQHSQSAE